MKKRAAILTYERLLIIDETISYGRYPSSAYLADKAKASIATIKRDIDHMRLFLRAPIRYSKLHEGWYYEKPVFRLPALFMDEKKTLAATLTKHFVETLHGTTAYSEAKELLRELTSTVDNPLGSKTTPDTTWINERIIFLEGSHAPVRAETWQLIIECLRHNYELSFLYKGLKYTEHVKRHVQPYQLLYSMDTWTLWAYDIERKIPLLFRLSRMDKPSIIQKHFHLPPDFDYRTISDGRFGTWTSNTLYHFKLSFYGIDAGLAAERSWGADEKRIRHADGSLSVEFTGCQLEPVLSYILSRGANAIPHAPKELCTA